MTPQHKGFAVFVFVAILALLILLFCDWLASDAVTLDDDDPRGY